ncbi:DUF4868 domain-containing protein [Saccharococcus sp. Marseille-Q5394]|uniref:DUF4868 domain-containing protein n=1 Tax=Saccharococcus sp. Marseille-Q5394 TaxID=2972778 RepID=UPI0021C61148|nr:DUF4868 domain-containing protein [Saccharococcus sp. Marseille-Q5394]
MSISTIKERLELLTDGVEGHLTLYFVKKGRNKSYTSFKPTLKADLQEELLKLIITALDEVKDNPIVDFNPIASLDQTLEKCTYDYVEALNDILLSTEVGLLPEPPKNLSDFNFYLVRIKFDENPQNDFLMFRRVTKFKKLQNGIIGRIFYDEFVKVSSDLIGIDNFIDIVGYESQLTIVQHIAMERIFDITAQYQESAKRTLELIKQTDMIENFEAFYEDSISDGRAIRGLTKLLRDPERVQQVYENFDKVIELVSNMDLDVKFNDDQSKLVYESKKQLQEITFILRDAYYQTFITERKGRDELA